MAGIPHRCWRCWARITLSKPWWEFRVEAKKRCPSCGRKSLYIDKDRVRRNLNYGKLLCHCEAYHFPHRKKSGTCILGPNPLGIDDPVSPDDPRLDRETQEKLLEEYNLAGTSPDITCTGDHND